MRLNEHEINSYLQPFLGQYEDSFQQAWVDILESNPQTVEEITPIIRKVRNKAIKQYWNKKCKEVSLYKPIGKNGDERFTLESILESRTKENTEEGDNANMNVFWRSPDKVQTSQVARMDAVWGDHSWHQAAYIRTPGLFGEMEEKTTNKAVINAFRDRLKKVAGFEYVPEPMPMRNSKGSVIYYLFFASPNKTGAKIVENIFDNYRNKGVTSWR